MRWADRSSYQDAAALQDAHVPEKLVLGDVRQRYCDTAHEVHLITEDLVFPNPLLASGYLRRCRSYVLSIWRPGPPPNGPVYKRLEHDAMPAGWFREWAGSVR